MPRKPRSERDLKWGSGYVIKRILADGVSVRYRARWSDDPPGPDATWHSKTFLDRDAAEDHLRLVSRRKRDGRYLPPEQLTVKDVVDAYMVRGAGRWKPASATRYRQRAVGLLYPDLGTELVSGLTTARVQHWVDRLHARKYAPATIESVGRFLSAALHEAARLGQIPVNPAVGVRYPKRPKQSIPTWGPDDIADVLAEVRGEPMWDALYRLALSTGMRPGEIRALRWDDIDLEGGVVIVQRTMTRDRGDHIVVGDSTKTGRDRENLIPSGVVEALKAWGRQQKRNRLAALAWHDDDLVFDRGDGRFLPYTRWQLYHQRLVERAGVRKITPHQIRHTNATIELRAGTNIKLISERLGHQSIKTTLDLYAHTSREDHRRAADALGGRLFGIVADATTSEDVTPTGT